VSVQEGRGEVEKWRNRKLSLDWILICQGRSKYSKVENKGKKRIKEFNR
jgi:hypothetical protein